MKTFKNKAILFFILSISLLVSPQISRAVIYINNIPSDISVTEGQPLDIPLFIGAENLTGKNIELFIWKENLDGSGKHYFKDGQWFIFNLPNQIVPTLQFGPMLEYFYTFWRAFDNTQGLKSFSLNICMDGELDSQLTSSSFMCGKRKIFINPAGNTCNDIYLSTPSINHTIEKGKSVTANIVVKDSCGNLIDFIATKTQPWISFSNQKGLLRVTMQTTNLSAGTYTDTIKVTAESSSKSIPVTLTVKDTTSSTPPTKNPMPPNPFPIITPCTPAYLNPWPVSITADQGEIKTQNVNITDNCGNPVSYTAQVIAGSGWLSASSSGTGTLNVTVRTTGLSVGQYYGQIKVTSGSLTGILDVILTVK